MGKSVLIAESRDVLRLGLKAVFTEDVRVSTIYEVTTYADLLKKLLSCTLDLVVVNQSLITDITKLPRRKSVILTVVPSMDMLLAAYNHGLCAYLMEDVPAELLRTTLSCTEYSTEGAFLIDPNLTSLIIESVSNDVWHAHQNGHLTIREREIVSLLQSGFDRPTVASKLNIADSTLKTHLKNISRKRNAKYQIKGKMP